MKLTNKTFLLADLPEAEEERIKQTIRMAGGRLVYHVDHQTDVVIFSPGEGEKTADYKRAQEYREHSDRPALMTPALFGMMAGERDFDEIPRNEKTVAAMGYMKGDAVWKELAPEIERFLKYEHASILDRSYLKRDTEAIYTLFQWLSAVEEEWICQGYSDEAYLRGLLDGFAQRSIEDDVQDLTSYLLDFKEHVMGSSDAGEADDPFAEFVLDDDPIVDDAGEESSFTGRFGQGQAPLVYYSCGRTVEMGSFASTSRGVPEPLTWTVIDREDDRALLLSACVLEILPFNHFYENVSWENSSLRQWLEEDFYEHAFTDAENERILPTRLKNGKADGVHGTVPEEIYKDTFDRIFLLSADEVKLYLSGSTAIRAGATDYVRAKNVPSAIRDNYRWWGRSMGINGSNACVVDYSWVNGYGENVNSDGIGVRPAMWIQL